ncbi:unnamed protein product [Dibothriocephalus latus]|uniref:Fucosyltransferase n=1 Tax=Dibothriocephalus latus TaxID=60516 RepID=A0A3P6PVD9_DIBLA|nr:unnamed protein product [Dibothriocephalus latus]
MGLNGKDVMVENFRSCICKFKFDVIMTTYFCLSSAGMVPIVMGGSPEDYYSIAPPNSYIHMGQFPTLGKLAEYIRYLDQNDTAYSAYFAWKALGTLKVNSQP